MPLHPYSDPRYATALGHAGQPIAVPTWGCPVLARAIPQGGADAMGTYPLAVLVADAHLADGLEELRARGLVSVVLVPDPLNGPGPDRLAAAFAPCRPFKTHHLIDRAAGPFSPTRHHAQRIKRAQRECRIAQLRLADALDDWIALYDGLVAHREIGGIGAFPRGYFEHLAATPAFVAFGAVVDEQLAAMTIWFEHDGIVYNHLTASNDVGYAHVASFGLYQAAIEHFSSAALVNLGGGAGAHDDQTAGLAAFKRGFANRAAVAHLCGAVLAPERYAALSQGSPETAFFPAYRAPVA